MAIALFIKKQDLVRNTIINGSVDADLFMNSIRTAQYQYVQGYLGTALYDEISNQILTDTVTEDVTKLLNDYIQPFLIHFSMVDYLPYASFEIKNGGLFKTTSEKGESVSQEEVSYLVQKHRSSAEFYVRRFIDYMSFNASSKFPKYFENNNEDMYPQKSASFNGWVL
jgi:hypothetical protein